jgi:HPt (histidine-containing phosphotransfer) domain-containing protein
MCAYVSADAAAKLASQIEELGTHNQLPAVSALLAQLQAEIDRSIQWITTDSQTSARCA